MIPHDLEQGKVLGSLIFGPTMVRIRGNYDDVNRLCTEIADKYGWAIVNVNLRPYYTEGAKTYGFEIAEQLGWQLPQHTVVPTAGGTILPKIYKAYQEFDRARPRRGQRARRSIPRRRRAATRSSPRSTRASTSSSRRSRNTIAKSIAIGNPADGYYALPGRAASPAAGARARPTARSSTRSSCSPSTEGIWTEPAGGTTLAATIKLIESGRIPKDERIVVSITGNGLKTLEAVQGRLAEAPVIEAKLAAFAAVYGEPRAGVAAGSR